MPRADARFELRLPAELLERVDQARGRLPRAAWVRQAVEAALNGTPVAGSPVSRDAIVRVLDETAGLRGWASDERGELADRIVSALTGRGR